MVVKRYENDYACEAPPWMELSVLRTHGGRKVRANFLFLPTINKETDAHFLKQIAASDSEVMHAVIGDDTEFQQRNGGIQLS